MALGGLPATLELIRGASLGAAEVTLARTAVEPIDPVEAMPTGPSLLRPTRAVLTDAVRLVQVARTAAPPRRRALLDAADRLATEAAAARPAWGEAWAIAAHARSLRDGPDSRSARLALERSYDAAVYSRYAAAWRVRFGLLIYAGLPATTQADVVDEAVWLARIDPDEAAALPMLVRQTPAYRPFLLRWLAMRVDDVDFARRTAAGGDRAAPEASREQ